METREQMINRVLFHLERTPLNALPAGPVCTIGEVRKTTEEVMVSPISNTGCIGFHIAAYVQWGLGAPWTALLQRSICTGFDLVEGDARVSVAPGAEVSAHLCSSAAYRLDEAHPMWRYLASLGALWHPNHTHLPADFYISESVIRHADRVALCGFATREVAANQGTGGYRQAPATHQVLGPHPSMPLAMSSIADVREPGGARANPGLM